MKAAIGSFLAAAMVSGMALFFNSTAVPAAEPAPAAISIMGERGFLDKAASRSFKRGTPPVVIKAPYRVPMKNDEVGVTGIKAVPKPKPKPRPKPKPKPVVNKKKKASSNKSWSGKTNGKCSSIGVKSSARALCSAIYANFGPYTIGGYRPGAGEHSQGRAIDAMIRSRSQGDAIAAYVMANVSRFNVEYIIWRQRYWSPERGSWKMMEDRGSATANHYDHVHVTVN